MTVTQRTIIQGEIDARALESASAAKAVIEQHLIECRDRYLALDQKLDKINALAMRGMWGIISALIAILGYLAVHGTQPLIH